MNNMRNFSSITTKFLFLNCNNGNYEANRAEINNLLNELNEINYQKEEIIDQTAALLLIESLTNIPSHEENLINKACSLITILVDKQNVKLSSVKFNKTVQWFLKTLDFNNPPNTNDVLYAMKSLFKQHPADYIMNYNTLLDPESILMCLLDKKTLGLMKPQENLVSDDIVITGLLCIESLLLNLKELTERDGLDSLVEVVGFKIIDIIYTKKLKFDNAANFVTFVNSALSCLHTICLLNHSWCEQKVGEILGIAQYYMYYGLPGFIEFKPQKVSVSQQSVFEPNISQPSKGGKIAKTRKPRAINKNKKNESKVKNKNQDVKKTDDTYGRELNADFDKLFLSPFSKTSDSDFSESEAGRSQKERHKEAKLRLSAIALIGLIAKIIEKRTMYGYWHSLFPNENISSQRGLLNNILKDTNPRCRIAALQASSLLLFGSKPFLVQAESRDKAPSSFMPFSVSLGNMIIAIYEILTQALSFESSLPVLTQILKCLSVLIQATPFHRLSTGFVTSFVKYIRRLVYHKDATIQVAALMVMEFLISVQEITKEISECVGIPKHKFSAKRNQNQLNDSGINEIIELDDEEEIIESDCEISEVNENLDNLNRIIYVETCEMSWLLQKILENLGVSIYHEQKISVATTPVRIESLQVLSSMAPHFPLLKGHLKLIANALEYSLNDQLPEIRLYAGKCLDVLGHAMNTYLLENATSSSEDIIVCQNFWILIQPFVVKKLMDHTQSPALRAVLCDFLSNIGVHIFERLPHNTHIQLISLLSGISCNDDNTTRAAAVRALAVYTLFPSLRDDLCFIENTAESIIQLMTDTNLFVRVKASWSMGNVSDALIANSTDSKFDRISNDLLRRMLEIASESSTDNDKVRSNAVRTLGNLLRLITTDHLKSDSWKSLSFKAIEKLVKNLTSAVNAKVKWNSCYAIGNFMKNPSLFVEKDFDWQTKVFSALCDLIINSSNFKVRINAATALTSLTNREYYGIHFLKIWSSLLIALEQSDNLVDFNEYKHRDNLQEQICFSLVHIIKLAIMEDFSGLKFELIPKLESTKQYWARVMNRVLPENAAPLLTCNTFLNDLLKQHLSSEQKNSIQIMSSCFVAPAEYM